MVRRSPSRDGVSSGMSTGRFGYYQRLSRADQAVYRASDRITQVPLPDPDALRALGSAIAVALRTDDRGATQRASRQLCDAVLGQLVQPRVRVRVLAVRPSDDDGELHGLYEHEEGSAPVIKVWMRTAAQERPVAFRTFVRTLLHELCHHLDYSLFVLDDSFHTEGFFRREAHLARQVLPPRDEARRGTLEENAQLELVLRPK